ncbi:MAG TPA: DUF1579 family protein [Vicinamibacteria bacterium]|nr:DUF1579 family protein [Vicinamibacteria bacterium]
MTRLLPLLALLATPQGAEAPPRPSAEIAQLRGFVGNWSCDGKVPAAQGAPESRLRSTVRIAPDLDGFWYSVRYEESDRGGFKWQAYWGYDGAVKRFVETAIDSFGGIGTSTSTGWQADRFVWTGEVVALGQKTSVRDTFTKRGREILHTAEAQIEGRWTVVLDETCHPSTP